MRPTLSGTIKDPAGAPLAGAMVFIYTAGPKEGAGVLCPSCYDDCRKRATTGADGTFKITDLDPALLFRILVVAKDCQPRFVAKVDPATNQFEVTLKAVSPDSTPNQRVRGRVVDKKGKGVEGAVVHVRGVTRDQSTRFGGNEDVAPLAVTDGKGEFVLNATKPFDAVGVDVEARGLAKKVVESLSSGDELHVLKLAEGVSLKGRLVKDGKPVANAIIGVAGAERRSEIFVGDFSIGTDADGRFLFANLPSATEYNLYGIMESLKDKGSLPARHVRLEGDGSTVDLGDISLQRGFVVAGKLRLTDGKPIPTKTRVLLARESAWDTLQTKVDTEGNFRFAGVPLETVTISTQVKGYRYSGRNASLDTFNPFRLIGRIQTNKTDLIVELEPGPRLDSQRGSYIDLSQEPLRGAEMAQHTSEEIKVTGTVVDADIGKPLERFTVTEGRQDQMRRGFDWIETRQTTFSNGTFTLFFTKQQTAPAVLVAAEGYLPQAFGPVSNPGTNLNISLKKGTGPAGVVLKPDGHPLTNVTVYLADRKNGVYLDGKKADVRKNVYRQTKNTQTDEGGHFSFAPQIDAYAVIVADETGFAQVRVEDLKRSPEVHLQPWARVEGKLMIGTRPGTNEIIRLGLANIPYLDYPRMFSPLSLFLQTTTDDAGRFVFERVPPVDVEVYHSPKVREGQTGTIPQTQTTKFSLSPGEKHELVLGGQGRPVIGKIVVEGYEGRINWRADIQSMELIVPEPADLPTRESVSNVLKEVITALVTDQPKVPTQEQREQEQKAFDARLHEFYSTESGRQYFFSHRRYVLNFSQDGSFRIEDVPGGKYRLAIDLREGEGGGMRFNAPKIAGSNKEIEVPDSPGGRSDQPCDLGVIKLQARNSLKNGKPAPDFEVKTLDDKTIHLSDFKGKYVLVDFWATWCGPCVAETPNLKETYAAFKDDPRFAMIGLSLDKAAAAPRDYATKNEIGWIQGFLGDWSKTEIPNRFGVEGIPAIFLIGPDGKVLAKDLRGSNIKSTVLSALSQRN